MTTLGTLSLDGAETVITFERSFSVAPTRLWKALATAEGLSKWLADGTIEEREGGSVRFEFDGDQTVTGEILTWDPPSALSYTWNINGEIPSRVDFSIEETQSGSTLTLTHTGLPEEMASGYTPGWHAYLDRLDQVTAGSPVSSWDDLFAAAAPRYK